jgi:RNA polymerase sigma factor (sigma-70 family)
MTTDAVLLQSYAVHGDEAAFRKLVESHLPMVYSAALRQVGGDKHLAEDVAQIVFRDLARDAAEFSAEVSVAGWLFRAAHFAAAKAVRTEKRRRDREAAAALEYDGQAVNSYSGNRATDWDALQAVLDQAMSELEEKDRDAIVLRFFRGLDFRTVGAELNISDDTARKRVSRALERLRGLLVRHGVTLSVTVLGTLITDKSMAVPPAGLAPTIVESVKRTVASAPPLPPADFSLHLAPPCCDIKQRAARAWF